MENHSVRNGLLMGVASILLYFIFYFINPKFMSIFVSFIVFGINIYFMYKAIADTRTQQGGNISIRDGFKASWISYVLGTLILTAFLYLLVNVIDTSLLDTIREAQIDLTESIGTFFGLPEEELQKQMEYAGESNPYSFSSLALGLPVLFLLGAIPAIILALIMKKEDIDGSAFKM